MARVFLCAVLFRDFLLISPSFPADTGWQFEQELEEHSSTIRDTLFCYCHHGPCDGIVLAADRYG